MQQGFTIWLTGLSGAGKTTIAKLLIEKLGERGVQRIELLDGDVVRTNLSKGLGFSKEDRDTNILRIGFVSQLLSRNGVVTIVAAISPYREARERVRGDIDNFVEVFVTAPLETLVSRDVKGLYKKALVGKIGHFTGVSDPYEPPLSPEVVAETEQESADTSVNKVLRALELLKLVPIVETSLSEKEEEKVISQLQKAGRLRASPVVNLGQLESGNGSGDSIHEMETIAPHGGVLVNRFLQEDVRWDLIDRIEQFPGVTLSPRQWSDVEMIATGAFSPLQGFVGEREYRSIITTGRLTNGLAWTIPILLLLDREETERLSPGNDIVLRDRDGKSLALLHLEEKYAVEKQELCLRVWGTDDPAHPGVRNLLEEGTIALGGVIDVIRLEPNREFEEYFLTPSRTRAYFRKQGWKSVAGFQTRNPVHRAHEYIQKIALELVDGLLLHPLVGETKADDVPAKVRMECYKALLEHYYPPNRVLLSAMPAAMRYAGPKEAILHSIIRQNYGCTHFIVGRDHAGVGTYYGTYDAQRIFDDYSRNELAIVPLPFEHTFYCSACSGMASEKTCPHGPDTRVVLSGTKVRENLRLGLDLPGEFSRPEVIAILRRAYGSHGEPVTATSNEIQTS